MKNIINIKNDYYYIGCNDRKIALFENVYPLENGVSYNSYFLNDEKTVLFDTVDKNCADNFFNNLNSILDGRHLDYMIINHLEPDHSALIYEVIKQHPDVKIVVNPKSKQMLLQFFEDVKEENFYVVKEGDVLETGKHKLTFVMAPMVHWPEVMVTYDMTDKILFSADAFGSFGALSGNIFDSDVDFNYKIDEYRRYYTNIVGKYGQNVNMLLNKAAKLEIEMVCPLHGLILKENISKLIEKYSLWATYTPERKSVLIVYASVYGATQHAAEVLASKLAQNGIKNIEMFDCSHKHHSYILAKAFEYSHIVIATTTYNNDIFVKMAQFLDEIVKHNLQNRTFALIENGSWACNCENNVKSRLEGLKGTSFIEDKLSIKSVLKKNQEEDVLKLANSIVESLKA